MATQRKSRAQDRQWRERRRREIVDEARATAEQMKGRNGMFHEITPVCIGDPYRDPVQVSRSFAKNKPNFKAGTAAPRPDATNHSGEPGRPATDAGAQPQTGHAVSNSKAISSEPFRAGSGRVDGFGPYMGAFSASDSSMSRDQIRALIRKTREEALAADRRRIAAIRAKTSESKPNFLTHPMKKGSYGTPGVLLSEIYLTSDPREERSRPASAVALRRSSKGGARTSVSDRPAFCSAMPGTSGVFGKDEETFIHAPIDDGSRRPSTVRRPASAHPFRPAGAFHAPESAFPYMPQTSADAYKPRPRRLNSAEAEGGRRESWRPSSASQSRPVRSVMLNATALKHSFSSKARG